jgi:hypothetical protein
MGFYYGSDTGVFIAVLKKNTGSYSFGELEGALDRGGAHRAHAWDASPSTEWGWACVPATQLSTSVIRLPTATADGTASLPHPVLVARASMSISHAALRRHDDALLSSWPASRGTISAGLKQF